MREEQLQQVRTCGCAHRYQPAATQRTVVVRQRSQSATPLRSPRAGEAPSRPTTPVAQNPRLTNGSRSRSEPHLGDEAAAPGRVSTPDSGRSSRATHWSRRSPEDLARLARLRSTSRSPVSFRDAPPLPLAPPPGSRQGGRPAARAADVGTGYGHSYSLPRPFDTTPTGRASRTPQHQQQAGKFERSRAPSQSGATYYKSRGRSGGNCGSTAGCHAVTTTVSRTMSESSLVVEWEEEDDDELEPCGGVNGNGHQDQEKPRYVSECRMEPRCQPAGYSSTVLCRRDSTWRRFVEEVRFQKCLVPANTVTVRSSPGPPPPAAPPTSSAPPPPPPPRRYRTELDVWVSPPPRPEGRQPIVLAVAATA